MPENVCFGCGSNNHQGLKIKSYWQDQTAISIWNSEEKYHGWANLLNGGVIATLMDCHSMCTAMAYAYKQENRGLRTEPIYRYATGTMNIKYLKPTSNNKPVEIHAVVKEVKDRKTILQCDLFSEGIKTVTAEITAIRVFDSSKDKEGNPFI